LGFELLNLTERVYISRAAFRVQALCPVGLGGRWSPCLVEKGLARKDPRIDPREGRESKGNRGNGQWSLTPRDPLVGLVLDTDEMVVRKAVGVPVVLGFHRSLPIPHHHIEDGDRAAKRR